jgi:hypothetical protein
MPASRASLPVALLGIGLVAMAFVQGVRSGPRVDHWQVRATGAGDARRVESISSINGGGAARIAALAAVPLAHRTLGLASVSVRADAAARDALPTDPRAIARELDRAVDWLARLAPTGHAPARIVLTLVGDGRRLEQRRVHVGATTTIDIAAAIDAKAGTALSAQVGRALATALHEASHATAGGLAPALSRDDDEYRASLVESCYLVDTLRPGDRLRLPDPPVPGPGEDWTATASREAAARVVADLERAGGGREIAWNDRTALLGIKVLCRARLALGRTATG